MKKINNIHTLSYFKKRLKDSGYVVWDIMNSFSLEDPRKWSVFVTCVVNRNGLGDLPEFEINDGGMRFQRNLIIKTKSMEVIMNMLNSKGILPDDSFYKKTQ
jgi:hypothetical protein